MKAKKINKPPPKPYVPKELKEQWEYKWLRNTWLILPKDGVGITRFTIKEAKEIINRSYASRQYQRIKKLIYDDATIRSQDGRYL